MDFHWLIARGFYQRIVTPATANENWEFSIDKESIHSLPCTFVFNLVSTPGQCERVLHLGRQNEWLLPGMPRDGIDLKTELWYLK